MLLARDERLVEFSFASRLEANVEPETLLRLVRQSWSENRRKGVTGFLRFDGDRIEETIEGPSTVILALAARILTDRRHGEIVIRRFGPISARGFADWAIAGLEAFAPPPAPAREALRLLIGAPVPSPCAEVAPLAIGRAT